MANAPTLKSKWRDRNPIFVSANPRNELIRVMGVVKGYVVARRHGCAPFLVPLNKWHGRFVTAGRPPSGGR